MKIGIVGAGGIGSSLALDLAIVFDQIIVKELNEASIERSKEMMLESFRLTKMLSQKYKKFEFEQLVNKLNFQTDYSGFETVNLVVESVEENYAKKFAVYEQLSEICHPNTVYFVNTSCIPIRKIAQHVSLPQNVIGAHFMNPVGLRDFVEVICSEYTSAQTVEFTKSFFEQYHKKFEIVNDSPGFVSNRLSHLLMNEAIAILEEGVATPNQIDAIMERSFGHKMGPLRTADLIGLDTVKNSLEILESEYQDERFKPCLLLKSLVEENKLGQKSGQGIYKYA